ncbi:MAG: GTPase [Desulfobacterales bacterium]
MFHKPRGSGELFHKIREFFVPKVDEKALAEALRKVREEYPPPVLWLLGKTQSGKTSIIRCLTGSPEAEIGSGFRSCTRTARFYDFPAQAPVVRFLDTQGLGEVAYDPTEDIRYCESQAHLVIAVVKVMEILQDEVFRALYEVRGRHPEWPVIIAQTCLHEAYAPDFEHVLPYPFDEPGWEDVVPGPLVRALLMQRNQLGKLPGSGPLFWVPIDLTQPEDEIDPVDYGIDALWKAIESASAFGLQEALRGDSGVRGVYSRAAHQQIMGYTTAAGAFGAMPMVDMAMVPALQLRMLYSLSSLYKLMWTKRTSSEFFGLLGAGFLAGYGLRWAGRGVIKLIPGWGQSVGAIWGATASAAVTFALGKAACVYLEKTSKGLTVNSDELRAVYAQAFARGKKLIIAPDGQEQS